MNHPPHDSFDALIFDMDGTLADTMPAHYIAWTTTLDKYGVHFPEDLFYQFGGVPTWRIINHLSEMSGVALDVAVVAEEKEAAFMLGIEAVQPIEQVVSIARAYRDTGKPMAVATGGYRRVADKVLPALGIQDWFDAVITADDVEHHKPAPDTFLKAAQALGVAPEKCRAFEDTDLGIQAAEAAGMDTIDIRKLIAS